MPGPPNRCWPAPSPGPRIPSAPAARRLAYDLPSMAGILGKDGLVSGSSSAAGRFRGSRGLRGRPGAGSCPGTGSGPEPAAAGDRRPAPVSTGAGTRSRGCPAARTGAWLAAPGRAGTRLWLRRQRLLGAQLGPVVDVRELLPLSARPLIAVSGSAPAVLARDPLPLLTRARWPAGRRLITVAEVRTPLLNGLIVGAMSRARPGTALIALVIAASARPPRRLGVLPATTLPVGSGHRGVTTAAPGVWPARLVIAAPSRGAGPGPGDLGFVSLLGPYAPGGYQHDDKNHDDYCG